MDRRVRPWAEALARLQVGVGIALTWWLILLPLALVRQRVRAPLDRRWPATGDSNWTSVEPTGPSEAMHRAGPAGLVVF